MKYKKHFFPSILLIAGCFLFSSVKAQNVDINILKNINPYNPSSSLWKAATNSAYPLSVAAPLTMLSVGYLNHNKELQHKGWTVVGALAINTVVVEALKYSVNRPRPYEQYVFIHPYDASEKGKSFPSGHTSTAFATATALSLECKKWYVVVPAYTWASLVGYARLYQGEHYPSDVLAGAVIGAGSAWLSHWLTHKYFAKRK